MTKPIFHKLAVIHPVYKLIMLASTPILEFELFTRSYLKTLKKAKENSE